MKKQLSMSCVSLAVLHAISSSAHAANIQVGGSCTLIEAITSANNDNANGNGCTNGSGADTIELIPGSSHVFVSGFSGSNSFTATPFITSDISIQGNNSNISRSFTTTNSFRIFAITEENASLRLEDLTISNGKLPYGGGAIYVGSEANLYLDNITLASNTAVGARGGAILSFGGTVTIQNSRLQSNNAFEGGAIAGRQANTGVRPVTTIRDTTITRNSATNGGGILHNTTSLTLTNSFVTSNSATQKGGGIEGTSVALIDTEVSQNEANSGGGIFSLNGGIRLEGSTISFNTAVSGGSGYDLCDDNQVQPPINWPGYGGGILTRGFPAVIVGSTISDNVADCGGGIAATPRSGRTDFTDSVITRNTAREGGGVFVTSHPITAVQRGTFIGGTFSYNYGRFGGGIHMRNSQIILRNATVNNNSAFNGAGIRFDRSTSGGSPDMDIELEITNSTISANTAALIGGGVQTVDTEVEILNSTIGFNQSTNEVNNPGTINGGGGIRISIGSSGGSIKMRNTIVAHSNGSDCQNRISAGLYSNEDIDASNIIEDGSCNTPALAANPRLLPLTDNGGNNQTHELGASSAAIDAGDNTVCTDSPINGLDQLGRARPDGPRCDIGAVESENRGLNDQLFVIPLENGKAVVIPL